MMRLSLVCALSFLLVSHSAASKIIGSHNDLMDEKSFNFIENEYQAFSGIGRLRCPIRDGWSTATAFQAGSYDMMITTAHSFIDPATGKDSVPQNCNVTFYYPNGSPRETVGIRRVVSRWSDPKFRGDVSNDIAIILLDTVTKTPSHASPVELESRPYGVVTLIGFAANRTISYTRMVKSVGISAHFPKDMAQRHSKQAGEPIHNPDNVIAASYDAASGSSGSPIFMNGRVIGIHQGSQGPDNADFGFLPGAGLASYNMFVLFDDRFVRDVRGLLGLSNDGK